MTLQKVNFYYANIKKIASKLYINCLIRGGKRIMARETLLQMNCSRFSEKIIDIIDLLFKIGWKYFSNDGMVEYLPIGDIDDYNWEKSALSDIEVHELVNFWNEILVPNLIVKARVAFVYYR